MDINTLRGLSTLLLLVSFVGLVFWVYSGRRKQGYEEAAQLPFADEEAHRNTIGQSAGRQSAGRQSAGRQSVGRHPAGKGDGNNE